MDTKHCTKYDDLHNHRLSYVTDYRSLLNLQFTIVLE